MSQGPSLEYIETLYRGSGSRAYSLVEGASLSRYETSVVESGRRVGVYVLGARLEGYVSYFRESGSPVLRLYQLEERRIPGLSWMVEARLVARVSPGRLYALSWLGTHGLLTIGSGFISDDSFTVYKVTENALTQLATVTPSSEGCNAPFTVPGFYNILYCPKVDGSSVTLKALSRDLEWNDVLSASLQSSYNDPNAGTVNFDRVEAVVGAEDSSGSIYALIVAVYKDSSGNEYRYGVLCRSDGKCGSFASNFPRLENYALMGWRGDWLYGYVYSDDRVVALDFDNLAVGLVSLPYGPSYPDEVTMPSPYGHVIQVRRRFDPSAGTGESVSYLHTLNESDFPPTVSATVTIQHGPFWTSEGLLSLDYSRFAVALPVSVYGASYALLVAGVDSNGVGRVNVVYKTVREVRAFVEIDGSDKLDPSIFDMDERLFEAVVCLDSGGVAPCRFVALPLKLNEQYVM